MSDQPLVRFEALVIPNEALDRGGVEVLRASIIDGELHVTLRRTFEEPDHWGGLLSEVARRVARAYAVDGAHDEELVVVRIRSAFVTADAPVTASKAKKSKPKPKKKSAKKRAGKRKKR